MPKDKTPETDSKLELLSCSDEIPLESVMESIMMIFHRAGMTVFDAVATLEMVKLQIVEDAREEE